MNKISVRRPLSDDFQQQ